MVTSLKQVIQTEKVLWLVILLVAANLMVFWYLANNTLSTPPSIEAEPQTFLAYWDKYLEQHETAEAYTYFVEFYSDQNEDYMHDRMHMFGSLLYKKHRKDAIYYCDESYFYACHHEVLGATVFDYGDEGIQFLMDFCQDDIGCIHSLGHGLVMHYGYERDSLERALRACVTTKKSHLPDWCQAGVFMEFTQHEVGKKIIDTTAFREETNLELCNEME